VDGQVLYLARDEQRSRLVLLKAIAQPGGTIVERVRRVVPRLSQLRHNGLAPVPDAFVEPNGVLYVAEQLPDAGRGKSANGESLATIRQRVRPTERQVLGWARQALETLDYLHRQRPPVVHGHICPENLLLAPDGTVRLGGLLDWIDPEAWRSPFAAPEQAADRLPDERSDLYSLAAALSYTWTGQVPAPVRDAGLSPAPAFPVREVIKRRQGPPLSPAPLAPPRFGGMGGQARSDGKPLSTSSLAIVLQKALAADAAQRYPSAREMLAALPPLPARPGTQPARGIAWLFVGLVGAIILVVLATELLGFGWASQFVTRAGLVNGPSAVASVPAQPAQSQPSNSPTTLPLATPTLPPGAEDYTVRPGDTLGSVAQRLGVSPESLLASHDLALLPGQRLAILRPTLIPTASRPPAGQHTPTITSITSARLYFFPVQPPSVTHYAEAHHDYPATDIFAPAGSPFVAVTSGVIHEVSRADVWKGATDDPAERGGLFVSLIGDDGVRYYGSHLSAVAPGIEPGVRVNAGQLLGYVGSSGNARGIASHLHFGISRPSPPGDWATRRGQVSPFPYLNAWRRGENRTPRLP